MQELARSKEKQSDKHSKTVKGQSNLTVGEHDSQKCERKLIEFEGKLRIWKDLVQVGLLTGSGFLKVIQ